MRKFKKLSQNPLGQILLATLIFCFVFLALFLGLYKAGSSYIVKERSRRAVNLTALTGGAVYADGLQLVRESNLLLMAAATYDAIMVGRAIAAALMAPPPLDIAAVIAAAKFADPNKRKGIQTLQENIFGIGKPPGAYPLLVFAQAAATANENRLSIPPLYVYNHETATMQNAPVPNMALRFRTIAELLPDEPKSSFSLQHDGVRRYFSQEEIEPAHNPRFPKQMRVKKNSNSEYAGWWVRRETNGSGTNENQFLSKLAPAWVLKNLRSYFDKFKLDVTDRDDPPCHTFALLGLMKENQKNHPNTFYQAGETRVDAGGLAAWNLADPIHVNLEKVDLEAFPILRDTLKNFGSIPFLDQTLKESDLLNGL